MSEGTSVATTPESTTPGAVTPETTESTNDKGTFSGAINSIKDAIADYSSLTVTTYTGDLALLLEAGQEEGATGDFKIDNLDFQKILNKTVKGQVTGDLKVACFNSHRLDGDAVVFRANTLPENEMVKLEAAHNAAIQAGQETREGIFDLVKDTVEAVITGK